MIVLNPGYDKARHYHGGATMRHIFQMPCHSSTKNNKTYMQVFIKDKITRLYFRDIQNKSVRILRWRVLVSTMSAPNIVKSVIKPFAYRICYNVRQLPNYMGYQDSILNSTQHHWCRIYRTINSTPLGYWNCQLTRRTIMKWFQRTHQYYQSYLSHIWRQKHLHIYCHKPPHHT